MSCSRPALAEALRLSATQALVAVIAPDELVPDLARLARRRDEVGLLEQDAMTRPVTIVRPLGQRLEFDAVVVRRAGGHRRRRSTGVRLLYVAMTRPIQHLSIVHATPLPAALTTLSRSSPTIRSWTSRARWPSSRAEAMGSARAWPDTLRPGAQSSWPTSTTPRARRSPTSSEAVRPHRRGDPAASTAAVASAVDAFGGLHLAHLNAGVTSWCGMGDDFDPEAYRRSMALNLDGVVYGIAAARRAIMASGGGTIVATASMAGLVAAPFDPIYAANKHADRRASSVPSVRATRPRGSASTRCARPSPHTNIIKGSEQTLLDMGFPIIEVADVVAAFQRILDSERPASAGTSWPDGTANPSSSVAPLVPAGADHTSDSGDRRYTAEVSAVVTENSERLQAIPSLLHCTIQQVGCSRRRHPAKGQESPYSLDSKRRGS